MRAVRVSLPPPLRIALLSFLLAGLAGLAASPLGADARLDRAEEKGRAKVAKVWLDLARHLEQRGLRSPAGDALARARELDPTLEDLDAVAGRIAALPEGGEPDEAAAKRIAKARADAAKAYDQLAKVFADEGSDPRGTRYLLAAVALDPSKARIQHLASLAQAAPILFQAPDHPMVVLLSLPKGWRAGKPWPALVSVEGAGANFAGNSKTFLSARGSRDWITISPHALSCTNELDPAKYPAYPPALLNEWNARRAEFDVAGLLAVLDHATALFGAEDKVAITGFSGGGNLCYGFTLRHPDRVRLAAPACANFNPGLAQGAPRVEDGGPPVHVMTGENDPHRHLTHGRSPPGIEEQTDWAMKAFEERGFTRVKRTMLPGVGHSALPREVWAFVDEVTGR
jgi:hypothetical protein